MTHRWLSWWFVLALATPAEARLGEPLARAKVQDAAYHPSLKADATGRVVYEHCEAPPELWTRVQADRLRARLAGSGPVVKRVVDGAETRFAYADGSLVTYLTLGDRVASMTARAAAKKLPHHTPRPLTVTMFVAPRKAAEGLVVMGKTNAPPNTELLVTLEGQGSYRAQDKVVVRPGGTFQAGPFNDRGRPLHGRYRCTVSAAAAALQPPSVQAVIGHAGEALRGGLVRRGRDGLGSWLEYTTQLTAR